MWNWEPVSACFLGSAVEPATKIPAGNLWANCRLWAALGLPLTVKTIAQARDMTRERDGGFFFDPANWSRVGVGRAVHGTPPALSPSSPS